MDRSGATEGTEGWTRSVSDDRTTGLERGVDLDRATLSEAIAANDFNLVNRLLEAGTDPNVVNERGLTPLLQVIASEDPELDLVQLLLEHGAWVNQYNGLGQTPIYYAIVNGYYEVARMLLDAGANPDLGLFGPLQRAAIMSRPDLVELLLWYQANPYLSDVTGRTAYLEALISGDPQIIQMLR